MDTLATRFNRAILLFMNEYTPNQFESRDDARERKRREMITLAKELSESHESFPFPGIDPKAYSDIKATEEEFPDYTTPIDILIERFKNEGMKVALGKNPESGMVYILPSRSDDIEHDSIVPRQLHFNEIVTDDRIKALIVKSIDWGFLTGI